MKEYLSYRNKRRRNYDYAHIRKLKERHDYYNYYPGVSEEIRRNGKTFLREYQHPCGRKRFYKRYASKQIRRTPNVANRAGFKRAYDLEWEID